MTEDATPTVPIIAIYLHSGHIAGLLQQAYRNGVLTSLVEEDSGSSRESSAWHGSGQASGNASTGIDFLTKLGLTLGGEVGGERMTGGESGRRSSRSYTFSETYYLDFVRRFLEKNNQIQAITTLPQAKRLEVGQFVEFQAQFRPSDFGALLEVLSPELIGTIVRRQAIAKLTPSLQDESDYDKRQQIAEQGKLLASEDQSVAEAAVRAIQTDFRTDSTAEVYGTVQLEPEQDLTAVVLCDTDGFIVSDHDRIFDGTFTVLGKVTSTVADDVPILERNKLLHRLTPETVDELLDSLRDAAANPTGGATAGPLQDALNMQFHSRIEGPSLRILPVAIFV